MSKVRVYEVARELGIENRELVNRIQSMGIQVRNHMSALEPFEVDRVKRAFRKDKTEKTVEEKIRKTVFRRRTVKKKTEAEPTAAAKAEQDSGTFRSSVMDEPKAAPPVESPAPVLDEAAKAQQAAPKADEKPEVKAAPVEAEPKSAATVPVAKPAAPSPSEAASEEAKVAPTEEPAAVAKSPAEEATKAEAKDVAPAEVATTPKPAAPAAEAAAPQPPAPADDRVHRPNRPTQPPPASQRLAHANLPPGVVARGNTTAPSAGRISDEARRRAVAQYGQQGGGGTTRRRRSIDRRDLGPSGRSGGGSRGRRRPVSNRKGQKTEITVPSAQKRIIKIEDQVGLMVLAQRMSLKATDVLMSLVQMGMTNITINSTLDSDTAKIIASEFGYEVENVAKSDDQLVAEAVGEVQTNEDDMVERAPIITVMGHVDHGKTSLLDCIRKAKVANGEAGGITQHIGAYRVETGKGPIVFLDTPGHEAFTSMRARGAQATDIVVLVVAADDGVMPQTIEAINHAKAAEVPIIVAVNKIDKPDAQPQNLRNELVGQGLQPEEWGGDTLYCDVSAMTGEGVDALLDSIALQAEMLELKAHTSTPGEGVVLEAYLDRGRGAVANILVRNGELRQGDYVLAGVAMGKVRALSDEFGKRVKKAGPATPVEVLGLGDLPAAGDLIYVVKNETKAKSLAEQRRKAAEFKEKSARRKGLDEIQQMLQQGKVAQLNLVIKSDVHGSVEALVKALTELSTDKVRVKVIHTGVGGITENDVMLATASEGIIIGFNVRPAGKAGATAKAENVEIRTYKVIYEAVDDVKKAMAGLLAPEYKEQDLGRAEVRQTFSIPKIGMIAGSYVLDGKIRRNARARLIRDSIQVWEGDLGSLRRFKDDVRDVAAGYECGIGLAGYNDIKLGDIVECYEMVEIEATL